MKALFTFLFIAFFLPANVYSQVILSPAPEEIIPFSPYYSAGLQAGINVSSLNNFNSTDIRIGLMLGLTGEYRFSELFGLAAEMNYSQQGTTYQNVEIGANYVQWPVLLTLHDNNFKVQAGAYGAVLLKAKALYHDVPEDLTDDFESYETGICLGLAYTFYSNTTLGARFYNGFQNVNKGFADSRLEFRNCTLQITGGYAF